MPPEAKNWLTDISPFEVSLCGKPMVPKATIAVMKAADGTKPKADKVLRVDIRKIDSAEQIAYGYVLIPDEPDLEGDVVTKEEVRKAAHNYLKNLGYGMKKGTGVGFSHQIFEDVGYPVESAVDVDGSLAKAAGFENPIPGAWFFAMKISDKYWEGVEKGEYTGFSMGSQANRTPVEAETEKSKKSGVVDNIMKKFGWVKLAALDYDGALAYERIWEELPDKVDALNHSLFSIAGDESLSKEERVTQAQTTLDQFKTDVLTLFGEAAKAYKSLLESVKTARGNTDDGKITIIDKSSDGEHEEGDLEMEMTKQDLRQMIADEVDKGTQRIEGKFDKLKTDIEAKVDKAVTDLGDLQKKVEKVAKGEEGEFAGIVHGALDNVIDLVKQIGEATIGKASMTDAGNDPPAQPANKGGNGDDDDAGRYSSQAFGVVLSKAKQGIGGLAAKPQA